MQHRKPVVLQHECTYCEISLPFASTAYSRIHFSQNGGSYTLGILGVLTGTGLTAGIQCTALNVLSLGGQSCTQQTVCCDGNTSVSLYHALFHPPLAIRTDASWLFFFSPCRALWSTFPAAPLTCRVEVGYPLHVLAAVSFFLLDIWIITSRPSGPI